jgi:hypothetical protein
MASDDLEQRIRAFVFDHIPWLPRNIERGKDVVDTAKIYGADVWAFVEDFGKQFEVDGNNFRWYHHTGPEGCNPLWLFWRPWWARKTHVPIRIDDLIDSARRHVWCIHYPEHKREV